MAVQQLERLDKGRFSDEEKEVATGIRDERSVEEQLVCGQPVVLVKV